MITPTQKDLEICRDLFTKEQWYKAYRICRTFADYKANGDIKVRNKLDRERFAALHEVGFSRFQMLAVTWVEESRHEVV